MNRDWVFIIGFYGSLATVMVVASLLGWQGLFPNMAPEHAFGLIVMLTIIANALIAMGFGWWRRRKDEHRSKP